MSLVILRYTFKCREGPHDGDFILFFVKTKENYENCVVMMSSNSCFSVKV